MEEMIHEHPESFLIKLRVFSERKTEMRLPQLAAEINKSEKVNKGIVCKAVDAIQ